MSLARRAESKKVTAGATISGLGSVVPDPDASRQTRQAIASRRQPGHIDGFAPFGEATPQKGEGHGDPVGGRPQCSAVRRHRIGLELNMTSWLCPGPPGLEIDDLPMTWLGLEDGIDPPSQPDARHHHVKGCFDEPGAGTRKPTPGEHLKRSGGDGRDLTHSRFPAPIVI